MIFLLKNLRGGKKRGWERSQVFTAENVPGMSKPRLERWKGGNGKAEMGREKLKIRTSGFPFPTYNLAEKQT